MNTLIFTNNQFPSKLESELDRIPQLSERMLVDLVNGLYVANEQISFKANQNLLPRLLGFFDGSSQQREKIIEQNFYGSLNILSFWVKNLTIKGSFTNKALTIISNKLIETRQNLETISADNIELISSLEAVVNEKINILSSEIKEIKIRQRTQIRIDEVTQAWANNRYYIDYPPLIQAILAIDDLSRGDVGEFLYRDEQLYNLMLDKISNQLKACIGLSNSDFLPLVEWMSSFGIPKLPEDKEVVSYLIVRKNRKKMPHFIQEYINFEKTPDWFINSQDNGEIPVILHSRLLLECLASDISDN
ncbi:YjcZ-like family protein [Nostoc sp. UHCC 0870]|uniref:YjcZ-like family protein n=1 Tax=Nostoc sp. UHCC 0870 TaxID=2914041 RepID=UPI001EDC9B32|nr:YjcZ-like family protein [Nostoc sp. UHCC 0870]UKP01544.1 YjcZ-like family protein [Nostoc sp. UHCC 0870]